MGDTEYQTLILEYQVLRNEIADRIRHQFVILGGSVTLWAAAIPILYASPDKMTPAALLFLPLASVTITGLYLEQGRSLVEAATYIHRCLRPAILVKLHGSHDRPVPSHDEILGWELFRKEQSNASVVAASAFRLLATLGPGAAVLGWLLVGIFTESSFTSEFDSAEYLLVILDLVLTVASVVLSLNLINKYKEIVEPPTAGSVRATADDGMNSGCPHRK